MMGSPDDEPERSLDETQHQVTLPQGFWLGETTVTQALWQAVMNDNPSHFKGDNLPVETVSWHDSQTFITTLNNLHPDLTLALPSEAEWEYACRAGTQTPFSFGGNIISVLVNYDGNYPYNNDEKSEYREKTVFVKSLPCNAWGLYEMHGNVWEWCEDVYQQALGEVAVIEPLNIEKEDGHKQDKTASHVLRGGCYSNGGGYVRSAIRNYYAPDYRFLNIGLRLFSGHRAVQNTLLTTP